MFNIGDQVVTNDSIELRDAGIANCEATIVSIVYAFGDPSLNGYRIDMNCGDDLSMESSVFAVDAHEISPL